MSELYDQYVKRFTITRADYQYLKSLDEDKSLALQKIIEEANSVNGELAVKKYLDNTWEMDDIMADHVNDGFVETAIYTDPYRLHILIPDYPPRLKEYNKTMFSPNLGYNTKMRWHHYMSCALHELRAKGAHEFATMVIVAITYHYNGERYDVDNYAIKFINDVLKYSKFIIDDSYSNMATYANGKLDMEFNGTEIVIASHDDFMNNPAAII